MTTIEYLRNEITAAKHIYVSHPLRQARATAWKRAQNAKRIARRLKIDFRSLSSL
jgi:hypothetical protein